MILESITLLGIVLGVIIVGTNGIQGMKSLLSLAINFAVIVLMIRLVSMGFSFVLVVSVCGLIILWSTIYFGVSDIDIADVTFISSLIIIVSISLLTFLVLHFAQVQGFGEENTSELEGMSLYIGLPFQQISIAMTILSCLGAVVEAAVSVATGTLMVTDNFNIKQLSEYSQATNIGEQILGTAFNTLFFGFFGGSLALFIWYVKLNYSFGQFINNKIFVSETLLTLLSALGVILVIPITLQVANWKAQKKDLK